MAPRPNWKGYLKLSLVSCSVALYSATSTSQRVRFHIINRETGHRVRNLVIDAETEEPVEQADRVKGYEVEKGQYVLVEDDELDEVALESTHTIDVELLRAARPGGRDLPRQVLLHRAQRQSRLRGVRRHPRRDEKGRFGRSCPRGTVPARAHSDVAAPRQRLDGDPLRYNTEVRDEKDYFSDIPNIKVPADMLDLAIHILSSKKTHFDADKFEDRYDSALTDLIKAKHAGKPAPKPAAPRPSNVINLMDALKRSVKAEQGGGKSAPRARGSHPRRARAASSHRRSSGHKARVKRAS